MFGGGFGTTQSTFGSGGFGAPTSTTGSVFGQPAQPQQSSLFGGTTTTGFGTPQPNLPAFGSGVGTTVNQTGAFGAQQTAPSMFGQQVRPTTGIFNATSAISPFSSQPQQMAGTVGTSVPFNAITGTDTMMKNGAASQINTRHQCITCMKEYENKSLEELRVEDYQLNRKGPQNPMFGGVTAGQPQSQQTNSLFSGIGGAGATSTAGTSTFGQATAFGQTQNQASGGLFSSLNQPKPAGVFFGGATNPSTSTAFGGGGNSLGFSFSNPTSQPQTSIFGANNNPATSNTGLGTQSAFSFSNQPQQQQQQSLGLFGQKPLTTTTSAAPAFGGGFGSAPANTALNKPLFGGATATPTFGSASAAPTFGTGTGSLFSTNTQQQQQNKPFSFSTPFSSTAQATSQPTFGTTSTSSFSFSNPVSTPQINFGGTTAPTFGNTGTTGAGSTFGAPLSFSLGSNTQQQPAGTGTSFGSGFFSSNTNNPGAGTTTTGSGLFGSLGGSTSFGGFGSSLLQNQQPTFQLQQQQQQQMQQQQMGPSTVSFATTPYKDNQLFYNLISNRKIEDMSKPTNPMAQRTFIEASRRKTSTSISGQGQAGQVSHVSIGLTPAVKNLTFASSSKNNSLTKFHVFDGFQDEDLGVGIDVLSPKSNVKRLVLKNADNNLAAPMPSSSSVAAGGEVTSFGLARRASMLAGLTPSSTKESYMSPLSQQRRVRITSLHNLDQVNGTQDAGNGTGEIIRKLDFGDSILSTDSHASILHDSANHGANGDGHEVAELFSNINGGICSKRGSEVDLGGVLNGNAHGQFSGSSAGSVCGVICNRPGYYCKPSVEELDKRVDSNGNCVVTGFEVGRTNYGRVKYPEPLNVANINLDEIVFFRHKEVVVYPDDENKPDLGKGLNAPAEIELERVFPIDRQTNELIRSPEKLKSQNYDQKLRKACDRLGAEFISYDESRGVWKFKVSHFSKYGLDGDEEDEDEDLNAGLKQAQKGLGGIPSQKLQQQQPASVGARLGPAGDAPTAVSGRLSLQQYLQTQSGPSSQMLEAAMGPVPPASDVEINPLTPCDSDDDDDDDLDDDEGDEDLEEENLPLRRPSVKLSELHPSSQLQSPATLATKYKPILKDCGTEKTQIMKSVMSIDEFDDGDHAITVSVMDSQPPIKKSRPSKRVSIMPDANFEDGHRLKERLSAVKKTPLPSLSLPPAPAIVQLEPWPYQEGPAENVFSPLASKTMTNGSRQMGGSRVCFLPNGYFVTVSQERSTQGFKGHVKVEQLVSYADKQEVAPLSTAIRAVLEEQMEARMTTKGVLFLEYMKILQREIKKTTTPQVKAILEHELVIWELCDILWPGEEYMTPEALDDDGFLLEQRRRLCQWLRNNSRILFGHEYNSEDTSVLGLLKKGQVDEACLAAIREGSDWLGVLLSTDPHLLMHFSDATHDLRVLEGMEKDTPDIFTLLAGNVRKLSCLTKEKVSMMSTYEWLQYFALYLWFEGPIRSHLHVPVEKAIGNYEAMMREVAEDEECALPGTETSSIANLAMHLLKMYSCTGYPVKVLLSPRTWGIDCLDYKLAWLLMREFQVIGYLPGDDCYKLVTLGYTGMLEGIGMWKWGYYVMGHIPGPDLDQVPQNYNQIETERRVRNVFLQRMLERNLKQDDEDEKFLVFRLNVPRMLFDSIKPWKSNYRSGMKNYDEEMWYIGRKEFWWGAYMEFQKFLTTGLALDLIGNRVPAQVNSMRVHLKRLEEHEGRIVRWEVQGKMLSSYLDLANPNETTVVSFLESVTKFTPCNTNQCAFLLDMALSAQKVIQLMLSETEVNPELKMKIFDSLLLFLENSAPKEYFEGLRSFINYGLDPKKLPDPFPFLGYPMEEKRLMGQDYRRLEF